MDIVSMVEELLELEEKLDHFYLTSRERREFQNEVMDRVMREEPQEKCEACKWFAICDIRDSINEFCRFEPTEPQTDCRTCKHNAVRHTFDLTCEGCIKGDKYEPQTERNE